MFENFKNPERGPVTSYLAYEQRRPPQMMNDGSPFYLAIRDLKQGPALYKEPWTGRAVSHFTLDTELSTSPARAIRTGLLYMLLQRTVLAKTNKGRHSETIFFVQTVTGGKFKFPSLNSSISIRRIRI